MTPWPATLVDKEWVEALVKRALPSGYPVTLRHPMRDHTYRVPALADLEALLTWPALDHLRYIADLYDCDDFAEDLRAFWRSLGLNTMGLVEDWSGKPTAHLYNLALFTYPDGTGGFRFIEPQTCRVVQIGYGLYTLTYAEVTL